MSGWIWPYLALLVVAAARLFVPAERWQELFVSALLGGFILTFPVQYLFETVLGAWTHQYPFFNVLGLPIWLAVVWFGETLIFLHFLPQSLIGLLLYITAFATVVALMAWLMFTLGIRPLLRGWTALETFILAFILHCAVVGIDFMVLRSVTSRTRL